MKRTKLSRVRSIYLCHLAVTSCNVYLVVWQDLDMRHSSSISEVANVIRGARSAHGVIAGPILHNSRHIAMLNMKLGAMVNKTV